MARPATGQVVEKNRAHGRIYALRFRAYGERRYVTLGGSWEGWSRDRAELELANVLADVRRGQWHPPERTPAPAPILTPTFHEFASEWFAAHEAEWRTATRDDYRYQLTHHLLPHFAHRLLTEITVQEVDRYRQAKVTEGRLGATTINKTITRLGQILEDALERDLIARNPVRVNARKRKLRAAKTRRPYLDRAEQIAALLDAAGELDRESRWDRAQTGRRALVATLVFAGLRISEALALRWRDVDLGAGRLRVGEAKTDAGVRQVPLLAALRDELAAHKVATRHAGADDPVFATRAGTPMGKDNARKRIFEAAVTRASAALQEAGYAPLPARLTQHALRHTYISLRIALGDDPATVSRDAGHADIGVTFRIYTHVMDLDQAERDRLRALVEGAEWAPLGTTAVERPA